MRNIYKITTGVVLLIINSLCIVIAAPVTGIINQAAQSWIIGNIIDPLLGLAGAIAFCVFIYGVILFLKDRSGGGDAHGKNKSFLFWGVIGLFIIFSVWSIVRFLGTGIFNSNVQLAG